MQRQTTMMKNSDVNRKWYVVDAKDKPLGRLASEIAQVLTGKNKPTYTPNVDCGDNVIIINASKVRLTGNKMTDRVYLRHTGYPGGQREMTPERLIKENPVKLIEKVVKGMLPKNRLGAKLLSNLYVFAGAEHNMAAQQPKVIDLNSLK